jgi:predicted signal transduction protein with EAL and GGDEF domain
MKTVAEGVEDQEDWDFLRRTGCDLAQGYFIARPMPAADIPVWMEAWREREWEWGAVGTGLTQTASVAGRSAADQFDEHEKVR